MFNLFKASNPDRSFRNVIESPLTGSPELIIAKADLDDFNNKTKIKVNLGEAAVFIVNGQVVQTLGPSTEAVYVSNYAFFSNFKAMFYGGTRTTACSVYYVRTGESQTPLLWGTPGQIPFTDSNWGNTRFFVGANGVFNVVVKLDNILKFIEYGSIGSNYAFSYEQLCLKLNPEIAKFFRLAIKEDMANGKCYDTPNQDFIAQAIEESLSSFLQGKCGLSLASFTVNNIELTDSPERLRYRTLQVDRVEGEQLQDLDDRGERKAILRRALEEEIIREAAAKGKLKELEQLGDNFWKVRLSELAETALSNPSIANMGASALGGFLGANTDIVSSLIGNLGGIISGSNNISSATQEHERPKEQKPEMSSDFWSFAEEQSKADSSHAETPQTVASQADTLSDNGHDVDACTKNNMIKAYTKLLATGKISQEQYDQLLNDL